MSCCGSKRQAFLPNAQSPFPGHDSPRLAELQLVKFRYTGQRSMTVRGGMTGNVYRFAGPGDEVSVDRRDAPGMAAVPHVEFVG